MSKQSRVRAVLFPVLSALIGIYLVLLILEAVVRFFPFFSDACPERNRSMHNNMLAMINFVGQYGLDPVYQYTGSYVRLREWQALAQLFGDHQYGDFLGVGLYHFAC